MRGPGRKSEVGVERLQITLAEDAAAFLDDIVKLGSLGRNRNDAASRILTDWIYANYQVEIAAHIQRIEAKDKAKNLLSKRVEA